MILKRLTAITAGNKDNVPSYKDHCLYTDTITTTFHCKEQYTGFGILSVLQGSGNFRINGASLTIDPTSFLVINRGSRLAIDISKKDTTPILLFFNTVLSEILANSYLFQNKTGNMGNVHDFSLVEHVHFTNATLRNHLTLLLDLGASCASFHALKADMVIRSMLDDLMNENFAAIRASDNIEVVKKSTRIELYKRLSMSKKWIEKNFAQPVTLNQAADIAMLNSEHFLRLFKQAFNITPHQFLTKVRIDKAKHLLNETNETVSMICQLVGFESVSSFSGLFKQRMGISPAQFRKEGKK